MKYEHAVRIAAPSPLVWATTVDVERWPEWTPTVTAARRLDDGPLGVGSRTRLKQPGQPETVWTVTEFVPGRRFVWEARRFGLRMLGAHEIEPDGAAATNRLGVELTGGLATLLRPILAPAMRRALAAENRGLKQRCESRAAEFAPDSAD